MHHRLLPLLILLTSALSARPAEFKIATFSVDVTIPIGHPCMGGGISPAKAIADPLFAKGFVLTGAEKPFVVVAFDWCEIRGTSFDKWKQAIAQAAATDPQRVLVTSTHVHDAPVMDEDAEKLLRDMEATGAWKNIPPPDPKAAIQIASVCQPAFNDACIPRVVAAVRESLQHARRVTHFGTGRAKVDRIASNRRFVTSTGAVSYGRYSRSTDKEAQQAGEGDIDPWLRTLSFWDGDKPVCALHSYAVHPMSSYGAGKVSADFPGEARALMRQAHPDVLQIYTTGCAGNVTAGKYNTGAAGNKAVFAGRLHDAMESAWTSTQRTPLTQIRFKLALMPLGARDTPNHTEEILRKRLASGVTPFSRAEAAMGLAWYERVKRGHRVEVPALEFDREHVLILLPAEAYVEFQLFAQELRPDAFVMVMGYGECGPGYIPIDRAFAEKDGNLNDWAWTPPGSEAVMKAAIREVLK
ncbi:MAG: hypothetical protein ABI318_21260 [Chthoniobacteraceae bacterium]